MNAGAYSAISNAVASVSAGVTPTVIGAIIDNFGWQASYFVTFGLIVTFVVLCIVIDMHVRKDYRKAHNMENSEKID